ncbi:uncharacterized protein TM35_000064370 [Trypanosoma theileri]|uniref:Uncharacterized protein n=1 Tax=Trypanosoma theileri TaxID=67003 RepID=A0A1X0P3D8_9TRYP|nr:uncharacterized protein TM35_000064370 [Trypanosoma theileri]ORC91432.1 hypothetical protein TM35_000064370 [Trypanosoma theileri]
MNCLGTLHQICCFLTKADLIELRQVSLLAYTVTSAFLSQLECRWLIAPSIQVNVELAPPCEVLAMFFLKNQRKLLVCATSTDSNGKVECGVYTHNVNAFGETTRRYVELPDAYGDRDSQFRMEGQRFLLCKTISGVLHVFDCSMELVVEIPRSCEEFFASQDGSRLAVVHEGFIYYLDSRSSLVLRSSNSQYNNSINSSPRTFIELQLENTLTIPIKMDEFAWTTISVGRCSILRVYDDVASVIQVESEQNEMIKSSTWSFDMVSFECCFDNIICSTYVTDSGDDEYVAVAPTGGKFIVICPSSKEVRVCNIEFSSLHHALVQSLEVVVSGSLYALVLLRQQVQEVVFFTADMSLVRCIKIGRPSTLAMLPHEGIMIAAPLPHATLSDHPLVEALESGVGTVFFFLEGEDYRYEKSQGKDSFSSVEMLSWISFSLVTASFLWTVSALLYNGWWLHLQLLFFGKVS